MAEAQRETLCKHGEPVSPSHLLAFKGPSAAELLQRLRRRKSGFVPIAASNVPPPFGRCAASRIVSPAVCRTQLQQEKLGLFLGAFSLGSDWKEGFSVNRACFVTSLRKRMEGGLVREHRDDWRVKIIATATDQSDFFFISAVTRFEHQSAANVSVWLSDGCRCLSGGILSLEKMTFFLPLP